MAMAVVGLHPSTSLERVDTARIMCCEGIFKSQDVTKVSSASAAENIRATEVGVEHETEVQKGQALPEAHR